MDKRLFIFSYNYPYKIDPILLDRINTIDIKPFKINDKVEISCKFIIKEMSSIVGINSDFIQISKEDIEFIIDKYTYEPGIRGLKRKIEQIFLKLNIDRIIINYVV